MAVPTRHANSASVTTTFILLLVDVATELATCFLQRKQVNVRKACRKRTSYERQRSAQSRHSYRKHALYQLGHFRESQGWIQCCSWS